jgi:hypothetical protein
VVAQGPEVIAVNRQVGVVDAALLVAQELLLNEPFGFGRNTLEGGRRVGNEESLRGLTKGPPQVEGAATPDAQCLLDLFPARETFPASLEQKGNPLVRMAFVNLACDSLRWAVPPMAR